MCFGSENPPESLAQLQKSKSYVAGDKQGERITALSRGLAEVTEPPPHPVTRRVLRVQLIHESVREFFLRENGFAYLNGSSTEAEGRAHSAIARSCAKFLLREDLGTKIGLWKVEPFHIYAYKHILHHVEAAENSGISQKETLRQLLDRDQVFDGYFTGFEPSCSRSLHRACFNGLPSCASRLIEVGAEVNITDRRGFAPLHCACAYKGPRLTVVSIVHLLLQRGADPNDVGRHGETPLQLTSYDDALLQATDDLLDYKADPNAVDLLQADRRSCEHLIRAGASVNGQD